MPWKAAATLSLLWRPSLLPAMCCVREVLTSGGKTDLPEFLAGITDVLTWGKSLIQFGQFAKSNMTYMELVSSPDPQCQSYVNWWPCVA